MFFIFLNEKGKKKIIFETVKPRDSTPGQKITIVTVRLNHTVSEMLKAFLQYKTGAAATTFVVNDPEINRETT